MQWKERSLMELADMICGNDSPNVSVFRYRSSSGLTRFFREADTDFVHGGSTRNYWVADCLKQILDEPHQDARTPPDSFLRVIRLLMNRGDGTENDDPERTKAMKAVNVSLNREGFEAFYADDNQCYLRHLGTQAVVAPSPNPHRPFTRVEQARREQLVAYLDRASEDEFIAEMLLPLLRQLGFHRITSAGHKDKALEFGKDIWMRYSLPTMHMLYFGIQAKKGKLDSAGSTRPGNANVAEVLHQAQMMLAHEVFDPEVGRKVLVDHAFIAAGGEITKAAKQFIGEALDRQKRSQIMFMDREDILNLYTVTNLPLPAGAQGKAASVDDNVPFF